MREGLEAVGADAARSAPAASIGPVTSATARALGLHVIVESEQSTIPALVDAIVAYVVRIAGASSSSRPSLPGSASPDTSSVGIGLSSGNCTVPFPAA